MSIVVDGQDEYFKELVPLVDTVKTRPEVFATGDYGVRDSALLAEKFVFDHALSLESTALRHINPLVQSFHDYEAAPRTRSKSKAAADAQAEKKSAPPRPPIPLFSHTPLDSLYLDGMNSDQIWEQIELKTKNVLKVLEAIVTPETEILEGSVGDDEGFDVNEATGMLMDFELDGQLDISDSSTDSDYMDDGNLSPEDDGARSGEEDSAGHGEESIAPLQPGIDERPELELDRPGLSSAALKRPAHPILDDGFFSIDDFNRETEELESHSRSSGRLGEDEDQEDDEVIDYFTHMADENEAFDEEDEEDIGSLDPSYNDFFAPPRRLPRSKGQPKKNQTDKGATDKAVVSPTTDKEENPKFNEQNRAVKFNDSVRVKTIAARKNTFQDRLDLFKRLNMNLDEDDDEGEFSDEDDVDVDWDMERFADINKSMSVEDMDEDDGEEEEDPDATDSDSDLYSDAGVGVETIERLKNDLFDDELPESQDAESAGSTHAKRQAQLAAEIAAYEAGNVAQKDWTLMGEATARARPKNSLLEEDLDFERQGGARAAPLVTEESTASLEEKIKARIQEARFDDVVRQRPMEDDKPFLPSRFFELDGSKSSRSLAQIYESEYTAARDGEGVIDDRDGKLAKEHEEIEKAWNAICYKLDALSNAHFTPKQPTATISAISNVATASLESALPTAAATSTLLAPEELHAPTKSLSALRDRSELTPTEKRAARAKERKKRKKASQVVKSYVSNRVGNNKSAANARKEKDDALRSLVKSGKGVTVVGKDSANLKRAAAAASNGKGVTGKAVNKRETLPGANAGGSRWKL